MNLPDSDRPSLDVLLVDDSKTEILLFEHAAKQIQHLHILHVARDGEQALQYLRREGPFQDAKRPDVVLLDINMPRKDGFEVLSELKTDPTLRSIPVVMLTTSDREEDVLKSYHDGASTFISKPLTFDKLKQTLESFADYWSHAKVVPR